MFLANPVNKIPYSMALHHIDGEIILEVLLIDF